jgi:hypothetical protein
MREYLKNINIVGAVMVYQEGEQCHWSLDWLYANCDRVCIILDNWNKETEDFVLTYRDKYPDITTIAYSNDPVNEGRNKIQGQVKKRFKLRQNHIREVVIKELKKMHDIKPIDLLIWPDSDETFINEFPKYLENFWNNRPERYIVAGFIEAFENFQTIVYQKMSPHGRVFKYDPLMTAHPYTPRTRYYPYKNERGYKIRNLIIHLDHFNEEYRKRRQFFDNTPWLEESMDYNVWQLPKDVREMTVEEIADYQPGPHGVKSKYPPITLKEYLSINKK